MHLAGLDHAFGHVPVDSGPLSEFLPNVDNAVLGLVKLFLPPCRKPARRLGSGPPGSLGSILGDSVLYLLTVSRE